MEKKKPSVRTVIKILIMLGSVAYIIAYLTYWWDGTPWYDLENGRTEYGYYVAVLVFILLLANMVWRRDKKKGLTSKYKFLEKLLASW